MEFEFIFFLTFENVSATLVVYMLKPYLIPPPPPPQMHKIIKSLKN